MQSDWVHSPNPSRRFVPRLAVMATARPPIVMRVGQPLKRGRDRSAGATEICRPQLGAAASSGWWAIRLSLLAYDGSPHPGADWVAEMSDPAAMMRLCPR